MSGWKFDRIEHQDGDIYAVLGTADSCVWLSYGKLINWMTGPSSVDDWNEAALALRAVIAAEVEAETRCAERILVPLAKRPVPEPVRVVPSLPLRALRMSSWDRW